MRSDTAVFQNTEIAFKQKSDAELKASYLLYKIIANPVLTRLGPPLTTAALKLKLPVKGVIRKTIFKQFCGGESIDGCASVMEQLAKAGIGTILDYSLEGHENEAVYEKATDEIAGTINYAAGKSHMPFSVFKLTALGSFSLLEKVAEGVNLTPKEANDWLQVKERFYRICELAHVNRQRVLVDAEHSWIQPVVNQLVLDAMAQFNKDEAIVFTTCQMYLKEGMNLLRKFIDHALQNDCFLGVKMVRGAYMELERDRAKQLDYTSPIHESKAATDACFDEGVQLALKHIDRLVLMAGTHNEDSCMLLMQEMQMMELSPADPRIWFAQLYGMSDNLSYNLSSLGYNVAKYLPYGNIEVVLPYLFRRAKENTSVAGQVGRELSLIIAERKRRGI